MKHPIHIIAGPTASGKSARAIALAQARDGVIINADATQLYKELQILSARPDAAELAKAPHRLYGVIAGDGPASAASWLEMARLEIEQAWAAGKLPIICGGTGFYLKALMEGLSPIPDVPAELLQEAKNLLKEMGHTAYHQKLTEIDPAIAARLEPGNSQRMVRAYSVWLATGRPLSDWQSLPKEAPFADAKMELEVVDLPREALYARCNVRFDAMMEQGALDEVRALLAKGYEASLPVMKAVGVPELSAHLRGEISQEEAIALAKQNTRRYAKRQLTWLRHQL